MFGTSPQRETGHLTRSAILAVITAVVGPALPAAAQGRLDGALRLASPDASASLQNPAFSPDGSRIVLTVFDHGYNDGPAWLAVLDLDSGALQRVTPVEDQDNVNLPGSAWSPTLDRIVFASDRHEADDLWDTDPGGAALRRLTSHDDASWYLEPSYSPDGRSVVFERSRSGSSEDGRIGTIWRVELDSGELVQLSGGAGVDDRQPNWSPAGDRIVIQRRHLPDDPWSLVVMAPDGTGQRVVTDPDWDSSDASFSADGRWVVFSLDDGTLPTPVIAVVPVTGGPVQRLTCSPSDADGAPSFAPDGSWVAFESHRNEEEPASLWRIDLSASTCGEIDLTFPARRAGRRVAPE